MKGSKSQSLLAGCKACLWLQFSLYEGCHNIFEGICLIRNMMGKIHFFIRTGSETGLQPLSNTEDVLTMNPLTSIVLLSPINTSNSQALTLEQGKLRNIQLQKFVSANLGIVKADNNDSRGASTWILGITL